MWAFQYKHGDRPLDGYTIQRAAGRGGFGEVYYAVSDSGREVALKVVQGYEQIELRGITQCMNLKSQHLVTIFDVKYNEQGRPFVIMEYVAGPNLRQMLDEHPAGLGPQKAAFFLREIAKGLQYLHDCGIVHRDLKPGNIFFENGIVKIGDYGLSKSISVSQHSGQTVTVGTVHYMAPEIGAGKYDRSIDIYALGALLYELLTGVPPFVGASPTEVLMKHLQAEPDLSGIEEPFRTAITRAMAKDPANRFQSVQQMVEAVFGAEHIQMSVSQFSPADLSMVAGRVAQKVLAGGGGGVAGGGSGTFSPSTGVLPPFQQQRRRDLFGSSASGADDSVDEDDDPIALQGWAEERDDKLPLSARIWLAVFCGAAIAFAVGLFYPRGGGEAAFIAGLITFVSSASAATGLLAFGRPLARKVKDETIWVQRLAASGPAALLMNVLALPLWMDSGALSGQARWTMIILAAAILFADPRPWLSPARRHRVTIGHALGVCLITFVLSMIFRDSSTIIALGTIASTVMGVQLLSPWSPEARLKITQERYAVGGLGIRTAEVEVPVGPRGENRGTAQPNASAPAVVDLPSSGVVQPAAQGYATAQTFPLVNRFAPVIWLSLFVAFLTLGIALLVASANQPSVRVTLRGLNGQAYQTYRDAPGTIGLIIFGVNSLVAAVFALLRSFTKRFRGYWAYLFRPLVRMLCVQTVITCGVVLANFEPNWAGAAFLAGGIVASALTFILVTFVPSKLWQVAPATAEVVKPTAKTAEPGVSPRRRIWALLLAIVGFFGAAGLHRLYVGKIGTGLLYLMTVGWFFIGTIVDVCEIAAGKFRDAQGRRLLRWEDEPLDRKHLAAAMAEAPTITSPQQALEAGELPTRRMKDDWVQDFAQTVLTVFNAGTRNTAKAKARAAHVVRVTGGGVLSALAGLFLFCATLSGLALAIDVPGMIDAGRPTPHVKLALLEAFDKMEAQGEHRMGPVVWRTQRGDDGRSRHLVLGRPQPEQPAPSGPPRPLVSVLPDLNDIRTGIRGFDLTKTVISGSRYAARGNLTQAAVEAAVEARLIRVERAAAEARRLADEAQRTLDELRRLTETGEPPTEPPAVALAPQSPPGAAAVSQLEIERSASDAAAVDHATAVESGGIDFARGMRQSFDPVLWNDALARGMRDRAAAAEGGVDLEAYSVAGPLRVIGLVTCGTFTVLGVSLLMLSRRRHGAAHLLRAVGGVASLLLAMVALHAAVGDRNVWARTVGQSVQDVADEIGRGLTQPPAFFAGALFVMAMLTLSWPARRERRAAVSGAPATGS